MNAFLRSISKVVRGAADAFKTFPLVIGSALAFSLVTIIRIHLDWPQQEDYNFLFNCLHLSFAFGALFSLAGITAAKSRFDNKRAFLIANILGVLAIIIAFVSLYFFGGTEGNEYQSGYMLVSTIAATRISMAMFVSFLAFIFLAGFPKEQSDFAHSFFMTHKAFFIALIYGIVIMSGMSGVAAAFNALVYHGMSTKVYMYIGTFTGFFAFTIFVGYFPDFRKDTTDAHREVAQKQPKFVEILFGYIMIPIMLALTAVLLLWAGRTIISGQVTSFMQLSGIATSYAIGGIWLYMMVTHHESGLAKFYKRIYPIAALVILAFEFWVLFTQIGKTGLKVPEYYFALVWIIAVFAAVLLIMKKSKAYPAIVAITCAAAIISVLPFAGYYALPVSAQIDRLEKALISQSMFEDGKIIPAKEKPKQKVRENITDAVQYLATFDDAKLPAWFVEDFNISDVFEKTLGFEQTWPKVEEIYGRGGNEYIGTSIHLDSNVVDIRDYQWAVNMQNEFQKQKDYVAINGEKGEYRVYWITDNKMGIPQLRISLNGDVILEKDMNKYLDQIVEKHHPENNVNYEGTFEEMSLNIKTDEIEVLLVFKNIEITLNTQQDVFNYWMDLDSIYINEPLKTE